MIVTKFDLVLFIILHVSRCERRIADGEQLKSEKTYMVYLLKATMSERTYATWLCGGAIVSAEFIITSAACVENVQFLYAIAGYKRYVSDKEIEQDDCTRTMKKKIVRTYVPVSFQIYKNNTKKQGFIDIALAKVESPFNFNDDRYEKLCSYKPSIISINLEAKFQEAGINAMVLGWGHTKFWRQLGDHKNYNQEYLHYGTTTILEKYRCQNAFVNFPNLMETMEKYMICSYNTRRERLNEHGVPRLKNCITVWQKLHGTQGVLCEGEESVRLFVKDKTRKNIMSLKQTSNENVNKTDNINRTGILDGTGILNQTSIVNRTDIMNGTVIVKGTGILNHTGVVDRTGIVNLTDIINQTDIQKGTSIVNRTSIVNQIGIVNGTGITNRTNSYDSTDFMKTLGFGNLSSLYTSNNRRSGICQNDHGGPLVTWSGKKEILIGVASIFKIADNRVCTGPFLFSSTLYNGPFLGCVLNDEDSESLRPISEIKSIRNILLCDSSPEIRGFDIIEKQLSWMYHPAGPAENERDLSRRAAEMDRSSVKSSTPKEAPLPITTPVPKLKRLSVKSSTPKEAPLPITTPVPKMESLSVKSSTPKEAPLPITTPVPKMKRLTVKSSSPKEMPLPITTPVPKMKRVTVKSSSPKEAPLPITTPVPKIKRLLVQSSTSKEVLLPITTPVPKVKRLSVKSSTPKEVPLPITTPVPKIDRLSVKSSSPKEAPLPITTPVLKMKRLTVKSSSPKEVPLPITTPVTEIEPPLIISLPSEKEHPPTRPPSEIIRPLPEMDRLLIIRPKSIIRPRSQLDVLSKIRHPPEMDDLSKISQPPERDGLSKIRLPPERDGLSKIRLPPAMEHSQKVKSPRKAKLPLYLWSSEVNLGSSVTIPTTKAFVDYQSDESFFKDVVFGNLEITTENYHKQPVVKIRRQRLLHKK